MHEYCFDKRPKKIEQKRFQVVNKSMQMKSVRKTQFSELNDNRFYFHDGIVCVPFGHILFEKLEKKKKNTELNYIH